MSQRCPLSARSRHSEIVANVRFRGKADIALRALMPKADMRGVQITPCPPLYLFAGVTALWANIAFAEGE
jgi:hypothetical protein